MATVLTSKPRKRATADSGLPEVREATPEELYGMLDRRARADLGVSADEFLRAWFAGEWEGKVDPDAIFHAGFVPQVEEYWRMHVRGQ